MDIENIRVYGFEPALRGMRNPQDSWGDADSTFCYDPNRRVRIFGCYYGPILTAEGPSIGPKDLEVACMLIRRGSEHRKFLRQIMVWFDITIPRFVWQELDTYKVATTRNSCSTMNTLSRENLTQEDFERQIPQHTLDRINELGRILREAKARGDVGGLIKEARVELKNELPEGFLQKATYMMSYETVLAAILQREYHRLPQWRREDEGSISQMLYQLPYMADFYAAATAKRKALRQAIKKISNLSKDERLSSWPNFSTEISDVISLLKSAR